MPKTGGGGEFSLGVRVSGALRRRVREAAKKSHRTMSDELRYLIEKALEAEP